MKIGKLQLWDPSFLLSSFFTFLFASFLLLAFFTHPSFSLSFFLPPSSLSPSRFPCFSFMKAGLPALHCLECAHRKVHHHQVTAQRSPTNWACSCWGTQSCLHTELLHILLHSLSWANGDHKLVLAKHQTFLSSYSMFFVHDRVVRFAYLSGYNCRSCSPLLGVCVFFHLRWWMHTRAGVI